MAAVVALADILQARSVWRGPARGPSAPALHPTGLAALDARLPTGGWPAASLSEILICGDGVGELSLLLPTLSQLTQAGERVAVVAPRYRAHAPGWHNAGVALDRVEIIEASTPKDALWASEQCLRSAACAAVLSWPIKADDRALRRLQVAAETGQTLGFAFRDAREARNPSPAALRLQIDARARELRVLKCRGGLAPPNPIAFDLPWH